MARLPHGLCFLLASLFLLLFAHSAPLDATPTIGRPLQSDKAESLTHRRAVLYGTGCATVPIVVAVLFFPVTLIDGICLCTQGGVLTSDSIARLDAQITAGGAVPGVIRSVIPLVGGLTNLLGLARSSGQDAVNSRGSTCSYPANSTPICSGGSTLPGTTCQFTCNSGTKLCGTSFCIPTTQRCVSGIPGKRSLTVPEVKHAATLCPVGLEACYTTDKMTLGKPIGWECIDPSSDIESCGGCAWPVAGQRRGEDCSALMGVGKVSCNRGKCEATSCIRGYALNGTKCALDSGFKTFWEAM